MSENYPHKPSEDSKPAKITQKKMKQNMSSSNTHYHHQKQYTPNQGLLAKYKSLPLKWKLYLGVTTFVVAYMADSIGNKIMEENMIDYEANRRVELELAKESEAAN